MQPFTTVTAVAAPMDLPNIDTDRIIPARFLRKPKGPELAGLLFHDWISTQARNPLLIACTTLLYGLDSAWLDKT